jgi:hypothetical protein
MTACPPLYGRREEERKDEGVRERGGKGQESGEK